MPTGENFPVAKGLAHGANILGELDRLAETAQKGDTVLFYYSGHGSRQPENPNEPETDGMDQVLLPANVGKYEPIKMSLKYSIVDGVLLRVKDNRLWNVRPDRLFSRFFVEGWVPEPCAILHGRVLERKTVSILSRVTAAP